MLEDMSASELSASWQELKEHERECAARRRAIEDRLIELAEIDPAVPGFENFEGLRITTKLTRKVDPDKADKIAKEHGLETHLPALFRWKAEVNGSVWKATSSRITDLFKSAIETKPARPSFTVTKKKEEP